MFPPPRTPSTPPLNPSLRSAITNPSRSSYPLHTPYNTPPSGHFYIRPCLQENGLAHQHEEEEEQEEGEARALGEEGVHDELVAGAFAARERVKQGDYDFVEHPLERRANEAKQNDCKVAKMYFLFYWLFFLGLLLPFLWFLFCSFCCVFDFSWLSAFVFCFFRILHVFFAALLLLFILLFFLAVFAAVSMLPFSSSLYTLFS